MKIIRFTAENVKKLKVVDITPRPGVNQITGRNGSGKTSVLDSIWWALGGKKDIQAVPIRQGEQSARIRLDLGDIIVERRFLANGAVTLTVRNAAGAEPGTPDAKLPLWSSPQELLDSLIGRLSFDPLAFAKRPAKDQYEELKTIATLETDIDALAAENAADFAARTAVNRSAKTARAQAEGIIVPADTPAEAIDESMLLNALEAAAETNASIATRKLRREQVQNEAKTKHLHADQYKFRAVDVRARTLARVMELQEQIRRLEKEGEDAAADLEQQSIAAFAEATAMEKRLAEAEPLPEPADLSMFRADLESAKVTNRAVAKRKERERIMAEAESWAAKSEEITKRMSERDTARAAAIAGAKFPVAGLGFGDGIVLYNGLPLDQASDAEQLKLSCAIAMAGNPKLRVMRIRDGSLLDDDALALISQMAADQDYQVWIERVDSTGKIGVVMEDGEVAADNQ